MAIFSSSERGSADIVNDLERGDECPLNGYSNMHASDDHEGHKAENGPGEGPYQQYSVDPDVYADRNRSSAWTSTACGMSSAAAAAEAA